MQVYNPPNAEPVILERLEEEALNADLDGGSWKHTKAMYRLSEQSMCILQARLTISVQNPRKWLGCGSPDQDMLHPNSSCLRSPFVLLGHVRCLPSVLSMVSKRLNRSVLPLDPAGLHP